MTSIADVLNSRPGLQKRLFFLAKRFVAGETTETAIAAVAKLNARGLECTVDFLGEDVTNEREATLTTGTYLEMIDRIASAGAACNVSVKLSAIGQLISEDLAVANLARITAKARPLRMFVRLDMEGSGTVDSTYRILERARASYQDIGPVVQAYLKRAAQDVERCIAQGLRVRLCKGAYKEPPDVAFQKMSDIRSNYVQLAQRLLSDGAYPGIATHDERIIAGVREFAARNAIKSDRYEFQMLYGIRPEAQRALVRQGYRMRVYVPFGTHWASYFYRRIAERRENLFFVLRSLFSR
jgi:proline dehydrogenase